LVTALTVLLAIGRRPRVKRSPARENVGVGKFVQAGADAPGRPRSSSATLTLEDVRAPDSALASPTFADPMQATGEREVRYGESTS
jgi:hypothetical protein